jgi:hypothetical protein
MGIFAIEIFLLDFPFKGRKGLVKSVWDFSGVTLIVSAVSMTPQKLFQRRHWHRRNSAKNISVVDVPMKFFTLTSPSFQRCLWHRWNRFSGVNYTAEIVSAVSITPRKSFQQCQWHPWNRLSGVNDTAEIRIISIFSANTKPYAKRL